MVHSIFEQLRGCIDGDADVVFKQLRDINVSLFDALYIGEGDKSGPYTRGEAAIIILYIIYAYSKESDFLILGAETSEERYGIAQRVNLPEYLHQKVVKLSCPVVRAVVVAYLNKQTGRVFKYLQLKKDLYEAALDNSLVKMNDDEGDFDIKGMSESDKYLKGLLNEIGDFEDQLRSELKFFYENKEEIDNLDALKKRNDNGNVESSKYIN